MPTIHMGVAASQMEKKGIKTDRGDINRKVADINKELWQTKARLRKVKTWLYAQPIANAPTFVNVMEKIADAKNLNTNWQRIANLKTRARVLIFLQNNKITDMEHFVSKVTHMNEELQAVSDEIKKVDRRLDTLATHLAQYEIYMRHKDVYEKYRKHDQKKRDDFYEKHSEEIELYREAKQYLETVLNGRKIIPVNDWKKEQTALSTYRYSLGEKFYRLKDEVRMTEVIKNGVEKLIQGEARTSDRIRSQDAEIG